MTEHKPLTAELPKPILHVKWVSDKKAEWWRVAGNPVSFAGNPPREAVPYQSKFISMLYADDVRSAVELAKTLLCQCQYNVKCSNCSSIDYAFPVFKENGGGQ